MTIKHVSSIYECPRCGWRGGYTLLYGYGPDLDGQYCNKCVAYEFAKLVPRMVRIDEPDLRDTTPSERGEA